MLLITNCDCPMINNHFINNWDIDLSMKLPHYPEAWNKLVHVKFAFDILHATQLNIYE